MRDRHEPRCVIQRSGSHVDTVWTNIPLAIKPARAIAAKPGRGPRARRSDPAPRFRASLVNSERCRCHRHVQRERATGLALAVRAMTCVQQQWKRVDLITHVATWATARQRQRRSAPFRHCPRGNPSPPALRLECAVRPPRAAPSPRPTTRPQDAARRYRPYGQHGTRGPRSGRDHCPVTC